MAPQSISEALGAVGGVVAGCGQASVLVITHLFNGEPLSGAELTATIRQSIAAGQTTGGKAAYGETSPANLQWLAGQHGVTLASAADWRAAIAGSSQSNPVLLGVSNAAAFGGNDAGVGGHYLDIFGAAPGGGFLAADPNQPAARTGGLVTYSADQIASAQPFAALTVAGKTGAPHPLTGTTEAATTGTAASGVNPSNVLQMIMDSLGFGVKETLWRGGFLIAGAILAIIGLLVLFRQSPVKVVGGTVKTAAKVVK